MKISGKFDISIMQARLRLLEFADSHSMDELLTATLDEMEALTGSSIGFYHFLEADQSTLLLQNWSTNTLKNMCTASGKGSHYDIAQAGVWVDCVNERRPVIHNDYASLSHRKGIPEGHAPVIREVVIPVFRGNLIKAIIGVGNKPTNYNESDVDILSQLGDLSWEIVERKQVEDALSESEKRVRRKLDAILTPEKSVGMLELSDIIDSEKVQKLMDEFYNLTSIGIGIIDLKGKVLVGTGWQDICTKFHRINPESCRLCIESDLKLSLNVTPGTFRQYKCKNHMWDIATPIMIGDKHVGNIFLGQFLLEDEAPDYEVFRKQARQYGFNEQKYIEALDRVPRWSRDKVNAAMSFYATFAQMIGNLSYSNIKLANTLEKRKLAEEALRRSEEEKTILNQIANVFLTVSDEAMYGEVLEVVLQVMKSKFGVFGYITENGELISPSLTREVWNECQVPDKSIVFPVESWGNSLWGRAIREKKTFCSDGPFRTPLGHIHIDHFMAVPIIYRQEAIGLISVANKEGGYQEKDKDLLERIAREVSPILHARLQRDVQEQRRMAAERDLKESEEKYRLLITNAGEAIFIVQDEVVKFPNPKTLEMTGYSAEELAEIHFVDLIHPGEKNAVFEGCLRMSEGEQRSEACPFRIIDKKGKEMWVQLTTAPIVWEKKPGILCFLRDITEQKKLEAQFIQVQKMEAVGRLAGGVAHDFNNMLTVIMGHTELSLKNIPPSDPLHHQLGEINKAARRSADLTRQLLAFARKQTIAPRILNLNAAVSGMLNMLRRLIGEDITLVWKPGVELWPVKMDSSQIDQVLANLCVNARDAISGVGEIIVETRNLTFEDSYCAHHVGFVPGDYVMIAVSDDGCGMDEATQTHLFEPFFTTKGLGKGTGLGLATVHGIVKQNDGFINVYSEPGQGTTFKIYFPRYKAEPEVSLVEIAPEASPARGETILMVEDEKAIVELGGSILEESGYNVLTAQSPNEAIRLAEEYTGDIHLLLTDVVMPEMNGPDLAARLTAIKPGLKCLYMSGYTANIIAHRGVLEKGVYFIHKPFSVNSLIVKVREVLDQKRPTAM